MDQLHHHLPLLHRLHNSLLLPRQIMELQLEDPILVVNLAALHHPIPTMLHQEMLLLLLHTVHHLSLHQHRALMDQHHLPQLHMDHLLPNSLLPLLHMDHLLPNSLLPLLHMDHLLHLSPIMELPMEVLILVANLEVLLLLALTVHLHNHHLQTHTLVQMVKII
jgi:hypothetical protein